MKVSFNDLVFILLLNYVYFCHVQNYVINLWFYVYKVLMNMFIFFSILDIVKNVLVKQ